MYAPVTQESTVGNGTAASSSYPDPEDMHPNELGNMPRGTSTYPPHEHREQTQYGQYPQVPTLASELVLADGSRMNPSFNQEGNPVKEEQQQSCQAYPSVFDQATASGGPLRSLSFGPTDSGLYRARSDMSVTEPDSVLGESGRWYHGYKEGKYFLPNDPVGIGSQSREAGSLDTCDR